MRLKRELGAEIVIPAIPWYLTLLIKLLYPQGWLAPSQVAREPCQRPTLGADGSTTDGGRRYFVQGLPTGTWRGDWAFGSVWANALKLHPLNFT